MPFRKKMPLHLSGLERNRLEQYFGPSVERLEELLNQKLKEVWF